jgi:hypothetical protein
MTSVVDEKQCQWCGTKSPAEAVRCDLCRLPFDRVVPPPRNWALPTTPALSEPAAPALSEPAAPEQPERTADKPAEHSPVTLARAELELPAWLSSLRSPDTAGIPEQASAPAAEQLPIYRGQPADVRTGPGRRRRSRPLRRLMIWLVALGLLGAFLVLAPGHLTF